MGQITGCQIPDSSRHGVSAPHMIPENFAIRPSRVDSLVDIPLSPFLTWDMAFQVSVTRHFSQRFINARRCFED